MLSARAVRNNTDGPAFPTKTPGRDLNSRFENANALATTVHRKGKNVLFPKTPLHPSSAQSKRTVKDQKFAQGITTRPLGDKTPLPNRLQGKLIAQSPSEKVKVSKTFDPYVTTLQDDDELLDSLESTKRPSSLRKHLKLPRNSVQKSFETPMNQGRHWEISDNDIDISSPQPVLQETKIVEDDYDEIEYCAPNTLDLPYRPPFDFELPDYTELGKKIRDLAFSFPFDDTPPPPEPEFPANELEAIAWETFSFPPLESEDPFILARLESSRSKTSTASKSLQKTDVASHRRAQSSLAKFGSAAGGMSSGRHTLTPSSINSKKAITSVPQRKQPLNPASAFESRTSKLATTTRTVKTDTVQKKPSVPTVQRTCITGPIPFQARPHTSLSLASKNKGRMMAPKSDNLSNLQILNHVDDEDFMFDV